MQRKEEKIWFTRISKKGPGRAEGGGQGGPREGTVRPREGPGRNGTEGGPGGGWDQGPVGPMMPSACLIIAAVIVFFSCCHRFF